LEGGRRPLLSESSKLLDNVRKRFRKNKQRAEQQASMELDARHGYAFSQEEGGSVSQSEIIRRYDTSSRPSSMGGSGLTRVSVDCSPKLSRQAQSVFDSGAQSNNSSIEQRASSVPRNIPGQIV